ncbi:hypothetical protein MHU86_13919 [Fragilaria crotonensis]|nr:hypothetical protein MHU86_13919 [Fragilaria crotonensis]
MTDSAVDDHVVSGVVAGLFPRNAANDVLATRVLTNPCRSSILNLGCTPTRVVASGQAANVGVPVPAVNPVQSHHHAGKHRRGRKGRKPKIRSVRKRVPSQLQVLDVLLKCLPGDLRGGFDEFFSTCVKNEAESAKHVEPTICYSPSRWIADGLQEVLGLSGGGYPRFQIQQLESLREDDVFRPSGSVSSFQQEFILMDVVLNRALTPVDLASAVRGGAVVPVRSRDVHRLDTKADGEFRTVIAVIPSVGHFYCARERRQDITAGQERKSLNPHDMSWLRLMRDGKFGDGGYVRCLHDASGGNISAWRVSLNMGVGSLLPTRLIRSGRQLSDADGPAMPPDVFDGHHSDWSPADRAYIFNVRLAESNAARDGVGIMLGMSPLSYSGNMLCCGPNRHPGCGGLHC